MRTVYKYPLEITDEQTVNLPKDAIILTVMEVRGQICIYAAVDTNNKPESRTIIMCGTGHSLQDGTILYIGSIKLYNENLVLHVFEPF